MMTVYGYFRRFGLFTTRAQDRIRSYRAPQRFGWKLPLRFVCMVPLIPLLALGHAAEVAFDWLDRRLA
jgi:hypothetical protein